MAETLGTQVLVESNPGAGGIIATVYVAKAPADGYTLLLTHLGSHAIVPAMRKDTGYDPSPGWSGTTAFPRTSSAASWKSSAARSSDSSSASGFLRRSA